MAEIDDKWFKAQQRKAGVTAEDIGARLGKDRSLVSRIYVGRQRMKLDEAKIFAEVLQVPLDEVLRRAGVADGPTAQVLTYGSAHGDAGKWLPQQGDNRHIAEIAQAFGARPGMDIWEVHSAAMSLQGIMPGDFMLVDVEAPERAKAGDIVVAKVYDKPRGEASTILRRFEPPVLVAASADAEDQRVYVVDGINVILQGKVKASWRMA